MLSFTVMALFFFSVRGTVTVVFTIVRIFLLFRGSGVAASVIFPSNAYALSLKIGLSFYLDRGMFGSDSCVSVAVPIGRREDTEGDRDAGVKVQIDWSRSVLS